MTMPAGSMTNPEPSELERRSRWRGASSPFCCWRFLKNSSKRSSKGVPSCSWGATPPPRFSSMAWVADMLTTASLTAAASSASESGPRAKEGDAETKTTARTMATSAPARRRDRSFAFEPIGKSPACIKRCRERPARTACHLGGARQVNCQCRDIAATRLRLECGLSATRPRRGPRRPPRRPASRRGGDRACARIDQKPAATLP